MFFTYLIAQVAVPEASAQAMSYYTSGNILWIFQWIWTLAIPFLFVVTGFSGKLGTFAKKYGKNCLFSYLIYVVAFVMLYQLLNLPLDFYASYLREHNYGLSTQTLARWFDNFGKWTMVIMVIALSFTWSFYLLLKKSPRLWWFYSSLISISITFIMTFAYPIWIAPLFNDIAQLFADAVHEHMANPHPGIIYKFWRSSHPSLGERVDFCNGYSPWKANQPLKYAEYFKVEEK